MQTGSKNYFLVVVICCLLMRNAWANRYSEPYSCYGDVCNMDSDAQFCDRANRFCRQCADVRDDCFTRLQMCNCSQFCSEYKYKQDFDKLRVTGCLLPPPPKNGRYTVNTTHVSIGAKLEVTCEAEYSVRYEYPMQCSNFSMWTGYPPSCEGSHIDVKTLAIFALGVCLFISLVINIICMSKKYCHHMDLFKRKNESASANEVMSLISRTNTDAPHNENNNETDTQRPIPSAPDGKTEHKVDIEEVDSSNSKNDINKAPNDRDVQHLPRRNNETEKETGLKNNLETNPDFMSNTEDETPNKNTTDEHNNDRIHGPIEGNVSQSVGNINNMSVVINLNTTTTPPTGSNNDLANQPIYPSQQPDKFPTPVTEAEDASALSKAMGNMKPDAPGPIVTQPEDGETVAKMAVGRGDIYHSDINSHVTVGSS